MYVEEWTEAMIISYSIMYHAKNKRTIWILSLHSVLLDDARFGWWPLPGPSHNIITLQLII